MANSKAISIRVPDELLEKIDRIAEEKYKSHKGTPNRSLVILDFIVTQLATLSDTNDRQDTVSVSDSVSIEEFRRLWDCVSTLSDSVKKLSGDFIALSDNVKKSTENIQVNREDEKPEQSQLSIILVPDNVIGLNGKELAQRLNTSQKWISQKKESQEFAELSRAKDPELIGWYYDSETKKFSPANH